MSGSDGRLEAMIARLAVMADDDRAFVLDRIGQDACDRLMPLLGADAPRNAVSPGLRRLMRDVAQGQNPPRLTAKAIIALRALQRAEPQAATAHPPDGIVERVSAMIQSRSQ